jgi:hypothetical protein
MTMPEASVDKHDRSVLGQHNVRPAGKVLSVEDKAKTVAVQPSPNNQFGPSIDASDAAHHLATLGARENISHGKSPPHQQDRPLVR